MFLVLLLLPFIHGLKFLAYNPQFANSHVYFIGKISDALIEAGHEVVILSPRFDTLIGTAGSKKTRIIEIPQCPEAAQFQEIMNSNQGSISALWARDESSSQLKQFRPMIDAWIHQCRFNLNQSELIQQLKEEHFDAAYSESFESCAYLLFDLLGITKYAATQSLAVVDAGFYLNQIPSITSYVPAMMDGKYGDEMNIWERYSNAKEIYDMMNFHTMWEGLYEDMYLAHYNKAISIRNLMANTSLVFLNSDPLVDFPKPTSSRIIDIGGISVHNGHNDLNKTWSDILNLRPKTVFLSFGTFVKAHLMPETLKKNIRETFRKFPDVTFIWKYEKPEHNVAGGIPNIIETTWAPQHDLLQDSRLSAFITHGGQGSITEATVAGVPLIVIPVTADQFRNAAQVKRNRVGVRVRKSELARMGPLESAIRTILEDSSYSANAQELASMVADRPFNQKDVFVRYMEFLAKHGPLRRLDHYGAKLNTIQYYLLDIVGIFLLFVIVTLMFSIFAIRYVLRLLSRLIIIKYKAE